MLLLVLSAVAALVVLAVGIGVVVGGSASDDDADEAAVVDALPATGPTITSGPVSITLPEGWVGGDVSGEVDGFGASVLPDDPEAAARVDIAVGEQPRIISLFGFDVDEARSGTGFTSEILAGRDDTVPAGLDLDEVTQFEVGSIERGEIVDQDVVQVGGRLMVRITGSNSRGVSSVIYIVPVGDDTYLIAVLADRPVADLRRLADSSAITFTVG